MDGGRKYAPSSKKNKKGTKKNTDYGKKSKGFSKNNKAHQKAPLPNEYDKRSPAKGERKSSRTTGLTGKSAGRRNHFRALP